LSYYVSLRSEIRVVMSIAIYAYKLCSVRRLYFQLLVGGTCLIYVICVCVLWCQTHMVFCFCFACPMLPVSLDCPCLIVPSVFSNVYRYTLGVHDIQTEINGKVTFLSYWQLGEPGIVIWFDDCNMLGIISHKWIQRIN
jgi:hypothetical protein